MAALHFILLFLWMLGFYVLHLFTPNGAAVMKERPGGVLLLWLVGVIVFLITGFRTL